MKGTKYYYRGTIGPFPFLASLVGIFLSMVENIRQAIINT